MTGKRRINIKHRQSRVLLSEVLPYELPVTFTNSAMHEFMSSAKISINNHGIIFRPTGKNGSDDEATLSILKVILGGPERVENCGSSLRPEYLVRRKQLQKSTTPFSYQIKHKNNGHRVLSIPHLESQFSTVMFYEKYRSALLYYCTLSPFSIRYPYKVARYTIVKDSIFKESQGQEPGTVEVASKEYDHLRSFFVYKDYDNVHKFHESPEYRECEKRFGHMLRLDISKCFDSVYTHSVSWALYGKQSVKTEMRAYDTTFGGQFDRLMQRMNDDETHGILIGPELSRLFAELILQRVDITVREALSLQSLEHELDYRIYRYVDDYFIFLKRPELRDRIVHSLEDALRPYRFHLNISKETLHETPFVSSMSLAKTAFQVALKRELALDSEDAGTGETRVNFSSSSQRLISIYKSTLSNHTLTPADLANYCLSQVERRIESGLASVERSTISRIDIGRSPSPLREINRSNVMRYLESSIHLAFYVYSGSRQVTPAIKLARIVAMVRKYAKESLLPRSLADRLDDIIHAEALTQMKRAPMSEESSIEGIYLLTILGDLPEFYLLDEESLCAFLGIDRPSGELRFPSWFNVLIVSELWRYIKSYDRFSDLRYGLEAWVLTRVKDLRRKGRRSAEEPLFVLNAIGCPHVSEQLKKQLLSLYGVVSSKTIRATIDVSGRWFTEWTQVDLHQELQRKRIEEVY